MRTIQNFLILKTNKHFHEVVEEGKDRGFIYPAPHVYIYKYEQDNASEEMKHVRGRPYDAPCALVRDSKISSSSIGIMIYSPDEDVHPDSVILAANIIRLIADDLGIRQFGILTDEVNEDNRIDVLAMNAAVSIAPSIFNKRI